MKQNLAEDAFKEEQDRRDSFFQFISGLLQLDWQCRWTPGQAAAHTFISREPYKADFEVPADSWTPPSRQDIVTGGSIAHMRAAYAFHAMNAGSVANPNLGFPMGNGRHFRTFAIQP